MGMSMVAKATAVLVEAEGNLRRLLDQALKAGSYTEVSRIASMAAACAAARGTEAPAVQEQDLNSPSKSPASERPSRGETTKYPRFVRAGDRLVKIGWSKRDRRAYEHRATRTAVLAVLDAVAAKIRPGKRFELDGIGEVSDATGKAVPTYQVYLTLRWLRDLGIISKRGKSDYVLTRVATRSDIETSWRELPEAA
jgi:hypothetical protein